jgi:flagellar biosynthesis protein FlhG
MQTVAVSGGKGGVGKTNVAVNLSVALAKQGKDVVLFDADLGLANVDLVMGLSVESTLADVVSGNKTLSEITVAADSGVRVIPAASGISELVSLAPHARAELIHGLSAQIATPDLLVVDTGAGIDETVQTFVAACQTPVLVVCDEPASLTDCYALIKVLSKEKNIQQFAILVNQVDTQSQAKALYERLSTVANKYLGVTLSYLGFVPLDPYLKRSVQEKRPLVSAYPRSPAAQAFLACAKNLVSVSREGTPTGLAFFLESLIDM